MNAAELLSHLDALAVGVTADGDRLRVRAGRGRLSEDLRAEIATHKTELIELLASRRPAPAAPEGEFPVSFAQRRLWFLDQLEPGSSAYNLGASVFIDWAVDRAVMEQAINDVVQRQAALRTVFRQVDGEPRQVVQHFKPVPLGFIDVSQCPAKTRMDEAERHKRLEAMRPFNLSTGPLFRASLLRLDSEQHYLLFSLHHIVCDGWSLGVFVEDLHRCLEARRASRAPAIAPLGIQYGQYAAQERARLAGPELERLLGHWRERLAGAPPTLELPTDRPRPPRRSNDGAIVSFTLPPALSDALRALARRERATLYMLLLALFKALLYRHSGQSDIVIGTPISNRSSPELERLVGLFVSTLPIRSQVVPDDSVTGLVAQIREHVLQAQAHSDLPFEKLVDELRPERSMAWSPIFQVVFVLQNTPLAGAFEVTSVAAMYDLSLFMWDDPAGIRGSFEYSTDLFTAATVERLSAHFTALAQSVVADPARPIARLALLSATEREQLLVGWNDSAVHYPRDSSLQALFDAVAGARPHAIAVESATPAREIVPLSRLSYSELARAADAMAARLQARGVKPGMPVGLCLERSVAAVVGLLAIVKTGAAYVPLDPLDPALRRSEIVREAGMHIALTQRSLAAQVTRAGVDVAILFENEWPRALAAAAAFSPAHSPPDALAYVMFTSGTTGRPKGVCVTHRNVLRLACEQNFVELGLDEVMLQFAPLSFDASTFEIWGALLNGGRLVVQPNTSTTQELAAIIRAHRITTLWLTAGFFHLMVENELAVLAGVRQVLAGGDVLSPTHVQRLLDAKQEGVVVNGYGPTENTTFTCCYPMAPGMRLGDTVPIGRPIANTRVYLLDAHGEPVPVGVAGELYAGGDGVARGYLGNAAAGQERFVPDPFAREPAATMYRTGDLARWRADGCIEFLGRRDRQVKVRGFRIELEEVEDALRGCGPVRDAAVVAQRDAAGTNALVAYLVPQDGHALDLAAVKHALVERLPNYMVPQSFVMLKTLPLTPNGKLNRAALPEPARPAAGRSVVGPRTRLETQLYAIWQQVLGIGDLSIHDNFFDVGGHSLMAVRVFAMLEQRLHLHLPISALFDAPTIARFAERLEHEGFQSPWSSLVAIQTAGSRPPLFMVPGVGGNVFCFSELARELAPHQPLYGLQSQGLDGRELPFERIEPMAAHYLSEVRRVQPHGPYHLGGTCFGGVVAYEMAQQLRAAGEQVAFLALLETWPPSRRRRPLMSSLLLRSHKLRFIGAAIQRNLGAMVGLAPSQIFEALRTRLRVLVEIAAKGDIYRGDQMAMNLNRVLTANHRALNSYQPRRYDGELLLVRASHRTFHGPDERQLWRALAPGGCGEVEIDSRDSGTMLISPHVHVLAERLRAALDGKADPPAPPSVHAHTVPAVMAKHPAF